MPSTAEPATVQVTPEFESGFEAAIAADNATRKQVPELKTETPPEQKPAAPVTPKAEDDPIPAHVVSDKAKADWTKQRERRVIAEKRAAELEAQAAKAAEYEKELVKLRASPPVVPQDDLKPKLEETTKQLEEYKKAVRAADLANDPEFRSYFLNKQKSFLDMAKNIVPADKHAEIEKWLVRPDSDQRTEAMENIVAEIGGFKGQKLAAVVNDMDRLMVERESELEKARTNWEQLQEKRTKLNSERASKEQADQEAAFTRALASTKDKEKGLALFQEREGDDAWNQSVKKREEMARHIFKWDELSADERAKAAIWAADGVAERELAATLAKEVLTLKAALAELRGESPSPAAVEKSGAAAEPEDNDSSLNAIQRRAQSIKF